MREREREKEGAYHIYLTIIYIKSQILQHTIIIVIKGFVFVSIQISKRSFKNMAIVLATLRSGLRTL